MDSTGPINTEQSERDGFLFVIDDPVSPSQNCSDCVQNTETSCRCGFSIIHAFGQKIECHEKQFLEAAIITVQKNRYNNNIFQISPRVSYVENMVSESSCIWVSDQ